MNIFLRYFSTSTPSPRAWQKPTFDYNSPDVCAIERSFVLRRLGLPQSPDSSICPEFYQWQNSGVPLTAFYYSVSSRGSSAAEQDHFNSVALLFIALSEVDLIMPKNFLFLFCDAYLHTLKHFNSDLFFKAVTALIKVLLSAGYIHIFNLSISQHSPTQGFSVLKQFNTFYTHTPNNSLKCHTFTTRHFTYRGTTFIVSAVIHYGLLKQLAT